MRFGLDLPPQIRIFAAFFIYSLALGGLFPRVGDIQLAMGIGEGALGAAMTGPGVGTLISLTFASPLLERIGYRRTIILGTILLSIVLATASHAPGPLALFAILLCAGLVIGAIEVVVNVEADRTEHLLGRRVMNRCHAFWSFGFFSAGMIGALAKQAGISPQVHLAAMIPVVTVALFVMLGRMEPAAARVTGNEDEPAPKFAMPSFGIMALVAFALSAMFLEGAGTDWSVIFMRNTFEVAPFINGLAFAAGALAQAVTRFFADGFVERYGSLRVARFLVLTLGTGALIVTFTPHPAIALIGFAMIGMGTSAMFPLAMSAAAQRTDRPAALNVAALAQVSFVAFLIGPPLLGVIAEHFGVRVSFGICLPLVVVSWFAVRALRPRPAPKMQAAHG